MSGTTAGSAEIESNSNSQHKTLGCSESTVAGCHDSPSWVQSDLEIPFQLAHEGAPKQTPYGRPNQKLALCVSRRKPMKNQCFPNKLLYLDTH